MNPSPRLYRLIIGLMITGPAVLGGSLVWMQLRVEPVITWGQLGEWLIGIVGFCGLVLSMKTDLRNLKDDIKTIISQHDGLAEVVSDMRSKVEIMWERRKSQR